MVQIKRKRLTKRHKKERKRRKGRRKERKRAQKEHTETTQSTNRERDASANLAVGDEREIFFFELFKFLDEL